MIAEAATEQSSSYTSSDPPFHWDLPATHQSILPLLCYIAGRLVRHDLHIALIISENSPFVIPVWPLPRKTQSLLVKIVRKGCEKYGFSSNWMTALAALDSKQEYPSVFKAYGPDSYLVQRSLLQREMVFAAEGLTLLSIDHIYTLKQHLCALAKKEWFAPSRDDCVESCVQLLHRINSIHRQTRFSKGYIARVYQDIPLQEMALDEVMIEYDATFCTASLRDITSDLEFQTFLDDEMTSFDPVESIPELPDTSTCRHQPMYEQNQRHPPGTDVPTIASWDDAMFDNESEIIMPISPVTATYPTLFRPSMAMTMEQQAEMWQPTLPSRPSSPTESVCSDESPSPLKIVKRESMFPNPEPENKGMHKIKRKPVANTFSLALLREQENRWQKEAFQARSRALIDSWSTTVPKPVCAKCHHALEAPKRNTCFV